LTVKKRIVSVYKGFYVIIPPQYAVKGIVAPTYYIDQLMQYIGKPYYISLLNAAELHGAAHQRSQRFSVMTIYPSSNVSKAKNNILDWVYRKDIPESFLQTKNSETGTVHFSNPELTAIDLIQYEKHIGGLSRAATVLAELTEETDFTKVSNELLDYTSVSAIQRLGFILDTILEENEQADVLYKQLYNYEKRLNYVPLSTRSTNENAEKNTRWKIYINTEIEVDEI
jgi:predicted transcriptional regulator of viral defense system